MIVRVAERAMVSAATAVYVAADHANVEAACRLHNVDVLMTREDHVSGTDRLAEVARQLALDDDTVVVNVQGDEPLIDPQLINTVAQCLNDAPTAAIATAAHRIHTSGDFFNPNVVKVVCDAAGIAQYFSRAPIPFPRDVAAALAAGGGDIPLPKSLVAMRHIGIYAYRAGFLKRYAELAPAAAEQAEALEQLRAMHHGFRIAVLDWGGAVAPGVDTPEDLQRVRAMWR